MSLGLNILYYTVHFDLDSQKSCSIVTPWDKYQCLTLPIGLNISPGYFSRKMSSLMQEIEYVHTYLDNLLLLVMRNSKNTCNNHGKYCKDYIEQDSKSL